MRAQRQFSQLPQRSFTKYPSGYLLPVFRIAFEYDIGRHLTRVTFDFRHDVQAFFCFKGSRGQGGEAEQEVVQRAYEGEAAGQVEQSASREVSPADEKWVDKMGV